MVLLAAAVLQGCAGIATGEVVPAKLVAQAQVPDFDNVRIWGDAPADAAKLLAPDMAALKKKYADLASRGAPAKAHLLALSGGADDGAFGAGLLVGWGARSDRPEFDLVTGVSAGALVAPFAFLGHAYDAPLSRIFVENDGADIYQASILSGVFGGSAIADNAPLARLIAKHVDRRMLARIAEERDKGRFLLIGTTNINAQRPVYWDMGRIARVGTPQALELFRKILLASAALPGIFPPVHIDVVANGKKYEEIHVDGGPTREVFLAPTDFHFRDIDRMVGRRVARHLWVVRNGKIAPEYSTVGTSALSVAARSLETLTKNQGLGDLERIYRKAKSDGIDFNLAAIPANFSAPRPAPFDRGYMTALYKFAHELGKSGQAWTKAPPELSAIAVR
jgi:predicted acylesterase/phospholipase RssA